MTVHGCAYESVGGKAESRPALVQGPVLAIAARRGSQDLARGFYGPGTLYVRYYAVSARRLKADDKE